MQRRVMRSHPPPHIPFRPTRRRLSSPYARSPLLPVTLTDAACFRANADTTSPTRIHVAAIVSVRCIAPVPPDAESAFRHCLRSRPCKSGRSAPVARLPRTAPTPLAPEAFEQQAQPPLQVHRPVYAHQRHTRCSRPRLSRRHAFQSLAHARRDWHMAALGAAPAMEDAATAPVR
jgi:hypothetical protein